MCFSAEVSFGASVLLIAAGTVAVKKCDSKDMMAFASIPILFGLQQLSEGILWVTIYDYEQSLWHQMAIYFYLLFAQVIWPIWIPYSIGSMEPDLSRRKKISYFTLFGLISSIYLIYCLFAYDVSAVVADFHIRYDISIPYIGIKRIIYLSALLIPIFISSLKFMRLLGVSLLVSLALAIIFYFQYIISVWCFFAAIISLIVISIVTNNKKIKLESN